MSYVDEPDIESHFDDSIDLSDISINDYIDEAHRIVAQLDANLRGDVDLDEDSTLVDFSRDFEARSVESGARVWKIVEGERAVDSDAGELISTTVNAIQTHRLDLDDDLFNKGDSYEVEDIVRLRKAEEYKTCALVFNRVRNKKQVEGQESITLGPAEKEIGDIEALTDAFDNPFTGLYLSIVGPMGY